LLYLFYESQEVLPIMKKALMALLSVAVLSGLSFATVGYVAGATGGIQFNIDKLGAHQNGGRGCTGCHAPHSGGKGGGGNASGGSFSDTESGKRALWGQDVTPLLGLTISTGDASSYQEVLPAAGYSTSDSAEVTGLMFCLSCHDGNVAKGGMMTNALYEQKIGVLPANVYGPNTIPTLLGNDGSSAGNYNNDHPVGLNATLGAVGVGQYFTLNSTNTGVTYNVTAGQTLGSGAAVGGFDQFVQHYGLPSFRGRGTVGVPAGATSANQAFVVCTTCHTPHTMYTVSATASNPFGGANGQAEITAGVLPTYFFLVGPYNPGSLSATNDGTKASSATQFCRQCHYSGAGGANESLGIFSVTTAW
jgi:hypothetical protein